MIRTVGELVAALSAFPSDTPVEGLYDSNAAGGPILGVRGATTGVGQLAEICVGDMHDRYEDDRYEGDVG